MKLDTKYFASDHDKFLFWMEDGYVKFEKFSVFYGKLPDRKRGKLYKQFKALPLMRWGAFKLNPKKIKQPPIT